MRQRAFSSQLIQVLRRKQPAVIRNASASIGTLEEIFTGARDLAIMDRRVEPGRFLRFYLDGKLQQETPPLLPESKDVSWNGYLTRISRRFKNKEFSLIIKDFQALHSHIFLRSLEVVSKLYQETGIPSGGANVVVFSGNYRRTPFGIHKDDQDVLTFVLSGRKKFLLWPFESLQQAAGIDESYRYASFSFPSGHHRDALRRRAMILEAGPGDVLWWPADWWHIAESDGSFATTIGIGFFQRMNPLDKALYTADRLWREGIGRSRFFPRAVEPLQMQRTIAGYGKDLQRALEHGPLRKRLDESTLSFLTALGFHQIPPPLEAAPLLEDSTRMRISQPGVLAWVPVNEKIILVGACGHILEMAPDPRLPALLSRLQQGRTLTVAQALDGFSVRTGVSRRMDQVKREALRKILSQLVRCRALAVE